MTPTVQVLSRSELEARCWHEIVHRGRSAHSEPGLVVDRLFVNGRVVATATHGCAA